MVRPEVQRLVTLDDALPDRVVVDVAAVGAWRADTSVDPWPPLLQAVRRSSRRFVFVAHGADAADVALLRGMQPALDLIESKQSLDGVIGSLRTQRLAVVSAELEEHRHRLRLLAHGPIVMLDIATGRLWNKTVAHAENIDPSLQPLVDAICRNGTRRGPQYRTQVEAIVVRARAGTRGTARLRVEPLIDAVLNSRLPKWLRDAVGANGPQIIAEERGARTATTLDPSAKAAFDAWEWRPTTAAPITQGTVYVLARTERDDEGAKVLDVHVRDGHQRPVTARGRDALRLLASLDRERRWFIPRALDVLDAMADAGLDLPRAVIDPSLGAYALNPDQPAALKDVSAMASLLPAELQAWLGDHRRELEVPDDPRALLPLVHELDEEHEATLAAQGLQRLVESDLALTLPILAKLEHGGGAELRPPVGHLSWQAYEDKLLEDCGVLEDRIFEALGWVDATSNDLATIVSALQAKARLPRDHFDPKMTPKQFLERYVALGLAGAPEIAEARAIKAALDWVARLKHRSVARGVWVPTRTGRWTTRGDLPLHSLPKRGTRGVELRSSFVAPAGMSFVSVDYNAEEVRLLAALSGDPALLAATRSPDMHLAVAKILWPGATGDLTSLRALAKLGTLGFIYGQKRESFMRSQPALSLPDAGDLYDRTANAFTQVASFVDAVTRTWKSSTTVTTAGGWRRFAPHKRAAFNTVIQGLGADILRFVLRELDDVLPRYDASIVHAAHDEIIVAAPDKVVAQVSAVVGDVMTAQVHSRSGLISQPVLKVNPAKIGRTWADLI